MPPKLDRNKIFLVVVGLIAATLLLFDVDRRAGQLGLLGMALGFTLYHGAFGFAGAYRRFAANRDMSGITAQLVMLAVAIVAFAPLLSQGQFMGQRISGAVAPVGVGMATGAFLFGIGMRLAGGCASGTLFAAGGGSVRMVIVLIFFCAGAFVGSLYLGWWQALPHAPSVSIGKVLGWHIAVPLQLGFLVLIFVLCRRAGGRNSWRRTNEEKGLITLVCGPWPMVLAGIVLAGLNVATLMLAGHPWSVTWGYTLWGAKVAVMLGWDPAGWPFWNGAYAKTALDRSLWHDSVSVMNFGIVGGAALAATLTGRLRLNFRISTSQVVTAALGGLLLGYGARLAYGCNIGAFFSGVASSSLHGWAWIVAAAFGYAVAVKLGQR